MSMKCSRCGKRFADIGAIGRHYRKSHPNVMKKKKKPAKTVAYKRLERGVGSDLAAKFEKFCRKEGLI